MSNSSGMMASLQLDLIDKGFVECGLSVMPPSPNAPTGCGIRAREGMEVATDLRKSRSLVYHLGSVE